MASASKANTSEEDLYGDLDDMFLSQSDGEAMQTSEGMTLSSSQSAAETTSQDDVDNCSSTTAENVNDLDLYDDLIVEEGQQRVESFQEMIKKYEEALKLTSQLEAENQALRELINKKESASKDMQKNFSSLLITAKGEISRKDRELNNLRKRLSGSPGSLSEYRIPRKTALNNTSSSVESDFNPLYASSPSGPQARKGSEQVPNKNSEYADGSSRGHKTCQDTRKDICQDERDRIRNRFSNNDRNNDRTDSRDKKCYEVSEESRSLSTRDSRRTEKCSSVNNKNERMCKNRTEGKSEQAVNAGIGEKINEMRNEFDRHGEKLKRDRHGEKERRRDRSEDDIPNDRRKVGVEKDFREKDNENVNIQSMKDSGKVTKTLDLREKLRLKRLNMQSSNNANTKESNLDTKSVEKSARVTCTDDRSSNIIKLKRVDDNLSKHESVSFSMFQPKAHKKLNKSDEKEKQNLSAEKEFLENLKVSVKKNESTSSYDTANTKCTDKRIRTDTTQETQKKTGREIRNYSDFSQDFSESESFTDFDRTTVGENNFSASSENYFSASETPSFESTNKTPVPTEVMEKSFRTLSKASKPEDSTESGSYLVKTQERKKSSLISGTCMNNDPLRPESAKRGRQERTDIENTNISESGSNFQTEENVLKNSVRGIHVSADGKEEKRITEVKKSDFQAEVERSGEGKTQLEVHSGNTDSHKSKRNSDSNQETVTNQKNSIEPGNDSDKIDCQMETEESQSALRRSVRLCSKSDSSVSTNKTNPDTEHLEGNETDIKKTPSGKDTVVDTKNPNEIMDDIAVSKPTVSGKTLVVPKKRKTRIRRSVTSETISSVTSVEVSERAADSHCSNSEETEHSSFSTDNTSTSDDVNSLEKHEQVQKWACKEKNCTIRMRHLHPKCSEPNLRTVSKQKERKESVIGIETRNANDKTHSELKGVVSEKTEQMPVDSNEMNKPEQCYKNSNAVTVSQNTVQEAIKNNDTVSNGTVEMAEKESDDSCSSSSSGSEYSRKGSTQSSDSSGGESSSETDSECSDKGMDVDELKDGSESGNKFPSQSPEMIDKPVEDNEKLTVEIQNKNPNLSDTVSDSKYTKTEGNNETKQGLGKDETSEQSEKESHFTRVGVKERGKGKINEEESTGSKCIDRSYAENNAGTSKDKNTLPDIANKDGLLNKDSEIPSEKMSCSEVSKDRITGVVTDARDESVGHEHLVQEAIDVQTEGVCSGYTSGQSKVIIDETSEQNLKQDDKYEKSINSYASINEKSDLGKDKENDKELTPKTCKETSSRKTVVDEVNDTEKTGRQNEISESGSEGSFGSNIVSERTVSSDCDDESEFSDSGGSSDSSYTGESSCSSSDEGGRSSSWESDSSCSSIEHDHADKGDIHRYTKLLAKEEKGKETSGSGITEKLPEKETSVKNKGTPLSQSVSSDIEKTKINLKKTVGNKKIEIVHENQKKYKEMLCENVVVGETAVSHGQKSAIDAYTSKSNKKESCTLHKKSSNIVSPDRSHLLQTLLKCVQFELNGRECVDEKRVSIDQSVDEKKSNTPSVTPSVTEKSVKSVSLIDSESKQKEKVDINKDRIRPYGNSSLNVKRTTEEAGTCVGNTERDKPVEDTEAVEMDIDNESEKQTFGGSSILSCDRLEGGVSENLKVNSSSKEMSSEQHSTGIENAKDSMKRDSGKGNSDGDFMKRDTKKGYNDGNFITSTGTTEEASLSKMRHESPKIHCESAENIFGSTSSLSESDSDHTSCGSCTRSSNCSTCSSVSGSESETGSEVESCDESEDRSRERSDASTDLNAKQSTEKAKVSRNKREKARVTAALDKANKGQEIVKDFTGQSEQATAVESNTSNECLKPCENNPYWIADEMPAFLKEMNRSEKQRVSKEKQSKKSPSSNLISDENSKPLTPAVKFVNLKVSPTTKPLLSPGETNSHSLSSEANSNSQPASNVKRTSLGSISSVLDTAKLELGYKGKKVSENPRGKDKKDKTKKTYAKNKDNNEQTVNVKRAKEVEQPTLRRSPRKKPSQTSVTDSQPKASHSETKEKKASHSETNEKKASHGQIKEKKASHSETKEKKASHGQNKDIKVSHGESKMKVSHENKEKKKVKDINNADRTGASKTREVSVRINPVKAVSSKKDLKSVGKMTDINKSVADVERRKEVIDNNAKQNSSSNLASALRKISTASRNTCENKEIKMNNGEKSRKEPNMKCKVSSKTSAECVPGEKLQNSGTVAKVDAVGKRKTSLKDRDSTDGKKCIIDTTRVLTEKIMELKIEKNMLEKELAEKQVQERPPLKMKIAVPKSSEVKSNKSSKENMVKNKVLIPEPNKSGKIKPLTVALAGNRSEDLKTKSEAVRTGSLNKREILTFEEKLADSEGYLSKSKTVDKVFRKSHKDQPLSLTTQPVSLKTFTIPKLNKEKKYSNDKNKVERVTKSKSESSVQRSSDHWSRNSKENRHNRARTGCIEEVKGLKKTKNIKLRSSPVKKYVIYSESSSSASGQSSDSDSQTSDDEDNNALVKAVFGSSDTSGNSGKSLTLEDLCKTRSSEDTDDVVKDPSPDLMLHSSAAVSGIGVTNTSVEGTELTKAKKSNPQGHSLSNPESKRKKHSSGGKSSEMSRKELVEGKRSIKGRKNYDIHSERTVKETCSTNKNPRSKEEESERLKSTNNMEALRKSPRIKALQSPLKNSSNENDTSSEESRKSNRTPRKHDGSRSEVRYFEISDKNPVLNKIVSPKKPKHLGTHKDREDARKSKSHFDRKNKFEDPGLNEAKGVPILLLEENTLDGIDYHDDVIFDGGSVEEETNEKELFSKDHSESDQSVEEGEVSESDEEDEINQLEKEEIEGTSPRHIEKTSEKLRLCSRIGRLSPIQFPSSSNMLCGDRDSSCKFGKATCIHERLGVNEKKERKRYRSDSDSCSDASTQRPKRRMRHRSTRRISRSYDRRDSPGNRGHRKTDRSPKKSSRRLVSPKHRLEQSKSDSPCRDRRHSRSRSASPNRGRRRRSRSHSMVRSKQYKKDHRRGRSRQRHRDGSDAGSPWQQRRNRSNSGGTSSNVDSSCTRKRSVKEITAKTLLDELSENEIKKSRKGRRERESSADADRRETVKERHLSNASSSDESSDEENERFSKLKFENRREIKKDRTREVIPESRFRVSRGRDRMRIRESPHGAIRRNRSRSLNRKRKRYISDSVSGSDLSDREKKVDRRKNESERNKSHKRSRTDNTASDRHEKKDKSKKR